MNEVATQLEEHVPALKRYALLLSRDAPAADDLVQECAARAMAKAHLYRSGTNLRSWLFTILHNLHVNEIRRNNKYKQPADPDAAIAKLGVPESQTDSIFLRTVCKTMNVLPDHQRRILYSVGIEGKSYAEVSDELNISIGTVKSRCFRARKALRERLDDADVALPLAA